MWSKGLLGLHSPQSLVDAIVFMAGLYFTLQSGEEHRQLCFSSVTLVEKAGSTPYLSCMSNLCQRTTPVGSNIKKLMLSKLFIMQTVKTQDAVPWRSTSSTVRINLPKSREMLSVCLPSLIQRGRYGIRTNQFE